MGTLIFRSICVLILGLALLSPLSANNLQITNVEWDASTNKLTIEVSWDNGWKFGTDFQDGAWIFIKYAPNGGPQWLHANITSLTFGPDAGNLTPITQPDNIGVLVATGFEGSGTSSGAFTATLNSLIGAFHDFKVFAIEMVKIPEGSFYLGGPGIDLSDKLHRGDDTEEPYHVTDDGVHTYGATSNDFGTTDASGYMASIPAAYPAGYEGFWCMKYKVSQEQYVEFLNTLPYGQQNNRTETDLDNLDMTNFYVMTSTDSVSSVTRNGVSTDANVPNNGAPRVFYCDMNENGIGNQLVDGQNVTMNYVSWEDVMAYLDWAGLRPMTDWEYEKICRGPLPAVEDEFAWGTSGETKMYSTDILNSGSPIESHSLVGSNGPMVEYPARVGMTATDTSGRLTAGASYYGVMGLSDYCAEIVVAAEDTDDGLQFTGAFGDGVLSTSGDANQSNWPTQTADCNMRGGRDPVADLNGGAGNPASRGPLHGIRGVR